jgi:hypothetical protein
MKRTASLNMMGCEHTTALLQEFFVERIFGRGLGHRDLQTLPRQTTFCWDFSKKEFIRLTH